MKKTIALILTFSLLACTPENLEDSLPAQAYASENAEPAYTSKNSRPQNWAEKITDTSFNNLYKVSDDVYRSEQPNKAGFDFFQQNNIASVLNLREFHKDDIGGSTYTGNLYRVPMNAALISNNEIIKALRFIKTAPKPIDVHCQHGSDRTGVTIAMYRIIFQDWSKEEAIKEMKDGGYGYHPVFVYLIIYIKNVNIDYIKTQVFS